MYRSNKQNDNKRIKENKVKKHELKTKNTAKQQHEKKAIRVKKPVEVSNVSEGTVGTVFKWVIIVILIIGSVFASLYLLQYYVLSNKRYYSVLGLQDTATPEEINAAYENLRAKKFELLSFFRIYLNIIFSIFCSDPSTHPDCVDCEEALKKIEEAYEKLRQ